MPKPTDRPLNYGIEILDQDKSPEEEEEQDANDNVMDDSPPKITAEAPEGLVDNASAAVASIVAQKSTRVRVKMSIVEFELPKSSSSHTIPINCQHIT